MKKFFTAVILAVFILSAQIAAAADVDWNSVPRINSKAQLATYIENGRRRGQTEFNFVLTYTKFNNEEERLRFAEELVNRIMIGVNISLHKEEYGTGRISFVIKNEYPGTRVANAYLAHLNWDDRAFNNLEPIEKRLYHEAEKIVYEANKFQSELEKARYIHKAICNRVESFEEVDHATAINALVYKKTDCQGFADAFYMLGRMCGLNVGRLVGEAGGGGHIWNTMTFEDGKTYCVDVTWGDNAFGELNSYIYFNAPVEIMQETHKWDWSSAPALQGSIDYRYSYGSKEIGTEDYRVITESSNSARTSNVESGLKLLAQKIAEGDEWWFTVMTPYDERYVDTNRAAGYFENAINQTNFVGDVYFCKVYPLGRKYLFFCAYVVNS